MQVVTVKNWPFVLNTESNPRARSQHSEHAAVQRTLPYSEGTVSTASREDHLRVRSGLQAHHGVPARLERHRLPAAPPSVLQRRRTTTVGEGRACAECARVQHSLPAGRRAQSGLGLGTTRRTSATTARTRGAGRGSRASCSQSPVQQQRCAVGAKTGKQGEAVNRVPAR